MNSITFPALTSFQLNWTLNDSQQPPQPINGATMQATLYAGRSLRDSDNIPGTPVPPIVGLVLPFLSAGLYGTTVPGTLDPPLDGVGYVLVIDAQLGGYQIYHKEQPVVIETEGSNIDLTTVDSVKNRAVVQGTSDDAEIQAAITGFSQWLLNYTGQGSLNSIQQFDEWYDGNGNNRLPLRTWPIQSLVSVTVGGAPIPILAPVSGNGNWGVFIAPNKRWITMRGGVGGFSNFPYSRYMFAWGGRQRGPCFSPGIGNVEVVYNAGNADTPADLEYAVRCVVAINYKRKGWQDMQSKGINSTGSASTTRYQDWAWPPEYDKVFEHYKRLAQIL